MNFAAFSWEFYLSNGILFLREFTVFCSILFLWKFTVFSSTIFSREFALFYSICFRRELTIVCRILFSPDFTGFFFQTGSSLYFSFTALFWSTLFSSSLCMWHFLKHFISRPLSWGNLNRGTVNLMFWKKILKLI